MAQSELQSDTEHLAVLEARAAVLAPPRPHSRANLVVTPETGDDVQVSLDFNDLVSTLPAGDPTLMAQRLRLLNEIGLALSAERNIDRLLEIILSKSRELTHADAGSLYLVEKRKNADGQEERTLFFNDAQNDTVKIDIKQKFAVSSSSLAGFVASTGETLRFDDVYELPADAPYKFNPAVDKQTGYRTKSVLVVPLKNHSNEVIGVLQLINRKRRRAALLKDESTVHSEVISFDGELEQLACSLASQAAVALENSMQQNEILRLLSNIEELFEAFVRASASAIEGRDPSTAGHSQRVTILTIGIAQAVSDAADGPFKDIKFTGQQIKELQYAGLLHDLGKIGVREKVLTKSHKIEPSHFEAVKARLLLLQHEKRLECATRKLELLQSDQVATASELAQLDAEYESQLRQIDRHLETLAQCNDPSMTHVPDDEFARQQETIQALAAMTYIGENGKPQAVLGQDEIEALSVRRGSLTQAEYKQIQAHAQGSYEFLREIPWTDEYRNVPAIAYAHHEKLNGRGYPRGLSAADLPIEVRMMTVADIYDALTAADRPYKKAMPLERALRILREEAADGSLDPDVVDLFVNQQIYKLTEGWKPLTQRATT